jgi:hypothetical protein
VNATELCRVLLVGSVAATDVPELGDAQTREEVRRRLGEAGCELVYSAASERWLARLDGPVPELEGHDPVLALGTAELAVLATCWLHLRFLPGEDGSGDGQGWLDPDDLAELLGARLDGTGLPGVLERLARAGYLTMREGRVEAGPLLDTLNEPGAADQARALVARHQRLAHLRRRAAELDGGSGELKPSPPVDGGSGELKPSPPVDGGNGGERGDAED